MQIYIGPIEEAIPLEEQAIRLSPRDPELLGVWYSQIGLVHLLQSRTDEAICWLEKSRSTTPERADIHANLAAAYALRGENERATAELAEARRLIAARGELVSKDDARIFGTLQDRAAFKLAMLSKRLSALIRDQGGRLARNSGRGQQPDCPDVGMHRGSGRRSPRCQQGLP